MVIDHSMLVGLAKSLGLFYLLAMTAAVLAYACWPANKERFDKAARDVIEDEDEPWQ